VCSGCHAIAITIVAIFFLCIYVFYFVFLLLLLVGFDLCLLDFLWIDPVAETFASEKMLMPFSHFIHVLDYNMPFLL
jgi:cytochrome b subunit of formate dehydrogenase